MHLGPPGKGPMDRLYHFVWAHGFDQMHSYSDYKSDISVFLKTKFAWKFAWKYVCFSV